MLQWAGPFLVGVQFSLIGGNELDLKYNSLTQKKKNQIMDEEMSLQI